MTFKLFNTLTRKIEEFTPIDEKEVKFYSCGPTVYNYAHIGNFRSFIFMDVLRRYLKYKGFNINHVMNITDVDDKIIRDSQKEKKSLKEFTEYYTNEFFKDFEVLKIETPEHIVKATEHIPEMINTVKILLDKGIAYKGDDGSIYFSIKNFPGYGQLAQLEKANLKNAASGRMSSDEYEKDNAQDFALWKAYNPDDGDVSWEAEFGRGRPGWHIECSSMSCKYLGNPFDIHTGGIDLIFPHHTNEIAQAEAETGKKFVNLWAHCEHLLVEGKKMSKSLGNFFTLRDILAKGYDPMTARYVLLASHYRTQLNFTFDGLDAAKNSINRMNDFIRTLKDANYDESDISNILKKASTDFECAMDNDLGISEALASIFEFIKEINKLIAINKISIENAKDCTQLMQKFDSVLGVMKFSEESIDSEIESMIEKRNVARKNKEWAESDKIRDELKEKGILLDDTPDGTKWKRV